MDGGSGRRVIDERFELLERLGGGGMGLVWRARDLALHREVALKEVRPPDPELLRLRPDAAELLRKRVMREAVSLARVNHPKVVTIYHIVNSTEHPWLVMELVTGGSLQDRLDRGRLTPTEAAELGRGVLEGLRAAHASGVLHRDVKPGNVLLRPDGSPVLTDFGIAAVRESTNLTNTGELVGSPDYMAPERLRGHDDDPASDLWSLALMLYVAVEGHHPLRRASTLATLAAVLEEDIPPSRQGGPLAPVLAAVLRRDPTARPDAATLDRMLAEASGARTHTAPSLSGPPNSAPATPEAAPGGTATPADAVPAPVPDPRVPGPDRAEPGTAPEKDPAPEDAVPPVVLDKSASGTAGSRPTPAPLPKYPGTPPKVRRVLMVTGPVLALTVGLVVWQFLPGTGDSSVGADQPSPSASDTSRSPSRSTVPMPSFTVPTPKEESDLLTPAGARRAIRKLKPLMGGTKVKDFTLYPDHASAEAPVKDGKVYDRFSYRSGEAERGPGGGVMGDDKTVDLNIFDWDALPKLFRDAEKNLGIDDPTSRYLIVEPADVFHQNQPTIRCYVSDSYGGASLTATTKGRVIDRSPRE
ncbi:protein kinase [Streptomyces sp. NPDC005438]|uniref:protein kinase domain-containing protein n=1 Tax=Streptomyces sp. NPDC005438 TaxID=3156880 RepID=UPI0033A26D9C